MKKQNDNGTTIVYLQTGSTVEILRLEEHKTAGRFRLELKTK